MEGDGGRRRPAQKARRRGTPWAVKVFFLSIAISAVLSLLSSEVLESAGLILACGVLAFFILLGIAFDIVGVAVTASDERPFHSMAARKVPGAREALRLIRRANQVSSFCNDVVGDICGIVSGTTTAVIVVRLQAAFSLPESVLLSVAVTALVSGLTIGGKALGKTVALNKSTSVVYWVGRFLHLFHR